MFLESQNDEVECMDMVSTMHIPLSVIRALILLNAHIMSFIWSLRPEPTTGVSGISLKRMVYPLTGLGFVCCFSFFGHLSGAIDERKISKRV